jgi:hypothetical protein
MPGSVVAKQTFSKNSGASLEKVSMSIPITNPHYHEGSTQRSEDVDTAKYGRLTKKE